jgi:F-type H+-transporting ATPase subunit a
MTEPGFLSYLHLRLGSVIFSESLVSTWLIMILLSGSGFLLSRNLSLLPGNIQVALEAIIGIFENFIEEIIPGKTAMVFPFISTIWIFILTANLLGLIPGFSSPTADLSVTLSLAIIVFLSVHWFGIRDQGIKGYLKHYLAPNPIMLPFHLISEVSRTLALAIRLFGNVMSLEIAAMLVLLVAGILVPIPLLMLHIVEAVIQAYLFGMLALIYIAGGMQSIEIKK